ncbi:unnamed protein product [Brassica napus]|uniref:(rape) hypothetical protein n=1 Tax=Brassica napus TaxID=3708 RepID=A0A816MZ67_BRANA|nr:unnamed protein product [Brassica napus]
MTNELALNSYVQINQRGHDFETTAKPKKFQGRNELNQWYQIDRQKEEKEQVDSASVYYTEGYIEIEREGCLGRRRYGKSRELGEDMVRAESLE